MILIKVDLERAAHFGFEKGIFELRYVLSHELPSEQRVHLREEICDMP